MNNKFCSPEVNCGVSLWNVNLLHGNESGELVARVSKLADIWDPGAGGGGVEAPHADLTLIVRAVSGGDVTIKSNDTLGKVKSAEPW